jgi:hypothetical protein
VLWFGLVMWDAASAWSMAASWCSVTSRAADPRRRLRLCGCGRGCRVQALG